jgi:ATP-dependent helicase HrpA
MKSLRLGDIESFPFLDPPQKRAIDEGYRVLEELGALDDRGHLTELGEQLGRIPLDPRLGRMILGGRDERALREVVTIAAVLGLQDPRDRPHAAQQKADAAHQKFKDEASDFASYLKLWAFWQDARARSTRSQLYKLCRDNFLSYNRMREWEDIHAQLVRVMRELEFAPNDQPASSEQIHRALLPGLLSKIGMWNQESRVYVGARQTRFQIHPSSALARKPSPWVMAAELVETSQLFARSVAKIDPTWLEAAAGSLCKRSYGDPHWEMKAAQVVAKEQVTLYGLPVVKERRVSYAAFDPGLCRDMFITHALVRHEYTTKAAFMDHNQRLHDEVRYLRDKARRSDMVADEVALWNFFDRQLPDDVCSGKSFETWRRQAEIRDPSLLCLSRADLLLDEAAELSQDRYPDYLVVGGARLPMSYRFDPGDDSDGISISVPLAMLPQLDPAVLAWTIPGWHAIKLRALLDSLPKALRKSLAPVEDLVAALATKLHPFASAMLPALEREIFQRTGERVSRDAWDLQAVPSYLDFMYCIVDERDKVIASSRDLADLQRTHGHRAKELWARVPRDKHERTGMKSWDLEAFPASVSLDINGRSTLAYPALVDNENTVDLRLMESAEAALTATRDGLRKLYLLQLSTTIVKLEAKLPATLRSPLKRHVVLRALDDAFDLFNEKSIPRNKVDFLARFIAGRDALPTMLVQRSNVAVLLIAELDKVMATVKTLAGRPGVTRAAIDDIQSQLAHLAPADLLRITPIVRLDHITRYLKAVVVRLQRLTHDPQKDQQKAGAVTPLWQAFVKKRDELRTKGHINVELDDFGWLVEEFRVQTFAPELKTAVPVSAQRLQEHWVGIIGKR